MKPEIRNPKPEIRSVSGKPSGFGFGHSAFLRRLGFGCRLCVAFLVLPVGAQTPPAAPPRVIVRGGGGSAPIILQGGAQPGIDPLVASAMQQAGIDQSLTAQAEFDPSVIAAGEHATYRVVVTAMIEGVSLPEKLPTPPGLELAFTGRSFTYGGGNIGLQPRTMLNYRVSVAGPGTYVLPSYQGSANGKPVTIPAARLQVLPAGAAVPGRSPRLLLEVPPGEFYIGQTIRVRVVLLDPGDNTVAGLAQPQAGGDAFVADPGPATYRREPRVEGGRTVMAHICELLVTPVREGRLTLTAHGLAVLTRPVMNGGISLSNFSPLLDSEPVTVTVNHLPQQGELSGFTGGIGHFQVEPPKISTRQVRAGEPLTLTVTVRGDGNLNRLLPPKLDGAKGWQLFPPMTDAALPGVVQFTYTLIPVNPAVVATPALPWCYFDPGRTQYVDLTLPPVSIQVLPAPGVAASAVEPAPPKPEIPSLATEEREPVLTGLADAPGRVVSTLKPLQERPWFLGLQLVPAVALGMLWGWSRRRRYRAEHPEIVLKARARRGLRRQLRLARRAAAKRDAPGFVRAAVNALREASAPYAAANPGALVCSDILEALPSSEREGRGGQVVRRLCAAADEWRFVTAPPDGVPLLALQPEFERLAGQLRARL